MKSQDVIPVVISVVVIVIVAIVEKSSKTVAAITATMPLTAPLALWIVSSSTKGDTAAVESFAQGLLLSIIPMIGFLIAAWLSARQGHPIGRILVTGYGTWVAGLIVVFGLRRLIAGFA